MKKVAILLVLGVFLAVSCEKKEPILEGFDNIIGCWTNPMYEDNAEGKSIVIYKRAKDFSPDSAGIKFLKDSSLIERKNAGWCGTPPITYDNYSGKWQLQNGGEIKIDVAYWGGMEWKIWKIIDITSSTLKIEIISWNAQY